ncbi:MAG TPA: hypothetical protein VFC24_01565 [Casimicrobiaceae bacterium]|nr:hypothetical protein [Casimicrobiaceae bacterium]
MTRRFVLAAVSVLALLVLASSAMAQQFQSVRDCAVGKRVSTNDGRKGTIIKVDTAWSYCSVRFDDNGQEMSILYSLLNAEGGAAAPSGGGLAVRVGTYECISGGRTSVMDLRITGANGYSIPDGSGRFHLDSNGRIVFESGPLKTFYSKLLSGGRIGLNTDGGSFYTVACEFRKR